MSDQEYSFERFNELFSKEKHIHILERRVSLETQMNYFRHSGITRMEAKKIPFPDSQCEELNKELYDELEIKPPYTEIDQEYIKCILSELAISKNPLAYNFIKEFLKHTDDDEILDWGSLALMECKINLASDLTGEKQVYISTGLGGRGKSLRFCILLMSADKKDLQDYEIQIVEREASFAMNHAESEIEYIRNGQKYILIMALVSYKVNIKTLVENLIVECNQYGNFLSKIFTITNVKEFTDEEIEEIINKDEDKNGNN